MGQNMEMIHSGPKVDESKVHEVKESSPIWKNPQTEPSSKQNQKHPNTPTEPLSKQNQKHTSLDSLKLNKVASTTASLGSFARPRCSSLSHVVSDPSSVAGSSSVVVASSGSFTSSVGGSTSVFVASSGSLVKATERKLPCDSTRAPLVKTTQSERPPLVNTTQRQLRSNNVSHPCTPATTPVVAGSGSLFKTTKRKVPSDSTRAPVIETPQSQHPPLVNTIQRKLRANSVSVTGSGSLVKTSTTPVVVGSSSLVKTTEGKVSSDSICAPLNKTTQSQRPSLVNTIQQQVCANSVSPQYAPTSTDARDTIHTQKRNIIQPNDPRTSETTVDSLKTNHKHPILGKRVSTTLLNHVHGEPKEIRTSATPQDKLSGLENGQFGPSRLRPFKPRRHSLMPDWPDDVEFDEKEEVLTIDTEGNYKKVSALVLSHDIWHSDGVKYFVTFNEFYQPLKRGGHILIKFIGDVAKTERFCPIRQTNWRRVNDHYKVDIIKIVRKHFVIPDGDPYDQGILKRTGKSMRQYRHYLKSVLFKPATKTKAQLYDAGPAGHPRDSWIHLVDYWYSEKGKEFAERGKEARASQSHVHTTGATSYANIQADFEEKNEREPSHYEIFRCTHRRKDGTFINDTFTEDLLDDVDSAVQTKMDIMTLDNVDSSSTKSRMEIENEEFNKIMYGNEVPKRPVGFGFGVNRSIIFGVRGLLRETKVNAADNNTLALQNMEKLVASLMEENKGLNTQCNENALQMASLMEENKGLKTQCNENTQLMKNMTTQFSQMIEMFSTGKAPPQFLNTTKTILEMANSQVLNSPDDRDKSNK